MDAEVPYLIPFLRFLVPLTFYVNKELSFPGKILDSYNLFLMDIQTPSHKASEFF